MPNKKPGWNSQSKKENMKTENPIITDKIKEFLDTARGRKFFREITSDYTAANRNTLKDRIINPSEKTRKRKAIEALLEGKINELNIKEKLDNDAQE